MQFFTLQKDSRNLARIVAFMSALPVTKKWRIEISEERASRSVQQCRYLNGVAYKRLSDATGYERDDISEYCCGLYFGWKTKKVPKKPKCDGFEEVPLRTTTTDENGKRSVLSTTEFMDYVAFVQRFAASKGIYIPDPDEEFDEMEEAA